VHYGTLANFPDKLTVTWNEIALKANKVSFV